MTHPHRRPRPSRTLAMLSAAALAASGLAAVATPVQAAPPAADTASCSPARNVGGAPGSLVPTNLCSPAASSDDSSTLLVWNKPEAKQAVDFKVYRDGALIGTAVDNAAQFSAAQPAVDAFYGARTDGFDARVVPHSYKVTGLAAATQYSFTVRAVFADQTESAPSEPVRVTTSKRLHTVTVTSPQTKAVGDGTTDDTAALQKAIDICRTPGCTVVVPAGSYVTGALFLHGDMTLHLAEGAVLKGSSDPAAYPIEKGYYLYPVPNPLPAEANYTVYLRPPSLLNVLPADNGRAAGSREPGAVAANVRITGPGTIDGNGWKQGADTVDESGAVLPTYIASNASKVAGDGILAASQVAAAQQSIATLPGIVNRQSDTVVAGAIYGQYRSSLMTIMGVQNVYVEGITQKNPAFHGAMFLDSANVTVHSTRITTFDANNGDGIELGGVDGAIVVGNYIDSGDDQVNFAAGQGVYGAQGRSSQNAWIFGNFGRRGHGGVAIGSNTAAWVQHILAEDNVFYRTETGALRMKSTSDMAGGARDVLFRDTATACLKTAAVIATLSYNQSPSGYVAAGSADFTDITVRNVTVDRNNTSACALPTKTNNPVFDIQAGPGTNSLASTIGPFAFDHVTLRGVTPTNIKGLTGSTFNNVCFVSVAPTNVNPWVLDQYSTGNVFTQVSPMPGAGVPTGSC